jgi:glycine oxidase
MISSGSVSHGSGPRIAVIGAGVIGLACALSLRRQGAVVSVYDRHPSSGEGASGRAGGMIAPAYEAARGEAGDAFLSFALHSAGLWPGFASDIERLSGGASELDLAGTIACAATPAEAEGLENLVFACERRGVPIRRLTRAETLEFEPLAAPDLLAAVHLPGDYQTDAGRLVWRMTQAARAQGVRLVFGQRVDRIVCASEFLLPDGAPADQVLLATGFSLQGVRFERPDGGMLDIDAPRLHPVKGHMLALAPGPAAPRRVVRFGSGYAAPKGRWTLVGSTSEPGETDPSVRPEAVEALASRVMRVLPVLKGTPEVMSWTGIRPGTPDGAPVIGPLALPGVYAALGHYRNGVLLAPATGEMMARLMLEGRCEEIPAAFSPRRARLRDMASHSQSET